MWPWARTTHRRRYQGLVGAGYNLYTLAGAQGIRAALDAFEGGRIVVLTAAPAYKCPTAPYEAVMLVDAYCKKRSLRKKTEVAIHAAEPMPMPVTGPAVGGQIKMMLEKKGIAYFPGHQVTKVEVGTLHFADGTTAPFDLLLYVPPHRAPAVVKAVGLCAESGWVAVDRETMETKFSNVYAIGDVTLIPLKMGRPLPKAGVFANGQAQVVARTLLAPGPERARPLASTDTVCVFSKPAAAWRGLAAATSMPNQHRMCGCAFRIPYGIWARSSTRNTGFGPAFRITRRTS